MNALRNALTAPLLTCLLAVNSISLPLLAQSPANRSATKSSHTFAPAGPGQKVVYRPAGDNAIEIAAKPGVPTLADKAMAAKRAQSPTVRQASTTHMMQEPAEEVPAPAAKPQGERSVVVPNSSGVVMEEVPAGKIIQQGPWIDSQSGQVVGDHYNQPFFTNEQEGGVVMEDGMAAEGCSDCGCGGGVTYRDGLRITRPCADGCLIPCPRISIDNTQVFAGAQSFQNSASNLFAPPPASASFGVHEGVNLGGPFPFLPLLDLSMQMGVMGTQSNFNGGIITPNSRNQVFTTIGLFRRVDWGFQGGVVWDYMHDQWNYTLDMYQLRGDVSWVNPQGHEIGFWFTNANNTLVRTVTPNPLVGRPYQSTFSQTDIYAFYYRKRFCETNGVARIYGGATQDGDGIIGVDGSAPLNDSFALSGAFTYMIPNAKAGNVFPAYARETWNIQLSLVWFPGAGARQWTYHRPLLDVANNGNFLIKNFP